MVNARKTLPNLSFPLSLAWLFLVACQPTVERLKTAAPPPHVSGLTSDWMSSGDAWHRRARIHFGGIRTGGGGGYGLSWV